MPDDRTDDDALSGPAYVEATTTRGYVGIGVYRSKFAVNVGTLVRSAHAMGGTFVYTVGRRYESEPSAVGQDRHIPALHFESVESLTAAIPDDATLVCIEVAPSARPLHSFVHPERAVYLLGAEDDGLPDDAVTAHPTVEVPSEWPLNVATAGSVVLYDRLVKRLDRAHHGPGVATWWTR